MAKATFDLGNAEDIERYLGLDRWAHDGPGIGGLLKVRIEDFRVEEVSRTPALDKKGRFTVCLLYTSPSPRDQRGSRMPSSA